MPRFAPSAWMRPPVSAARRTSLFSMILMRHVCCLPRRVGIRPRWGSSPPISPSMAANRARLPCQHGHERSFQAGAAEHFSQGRGLLRPLSRGRPEQQGAGRGAPAEVKNEPELKGTRWSLHKKPADWTVKQTQTMHWLQRSNLKTARAWRIKEALRAIYSTATTPDEAKPLLKRWLSWASRCRLEPFKRLGRTITKHLPGVLNGFEAGKHNGRVEAMNRALQEATSPCPRLSPRRKLHRHGLPRRWKTHPFARPSLRPFPPHSTRNGLNPVFHRSRTSGL
jgi:hypothetical protein